MTCKGFSCLLTREICHGSRFRAPRTGAGEKTSLNVPEELAEAGLCVVKLPGGHGTAGLVAASDGDCKPRQPGPQQ